MPNWLAVRRWRHCRCNERSNWLSSSGEERCPHGTPFECNLFFIYSAGPHAPLGGVVLPVCILKR
jgi:hypothetical protein